MTEHAINIAEQFDDADQQHEAATLGMWSFLATEVLFFGAIFAGYTAFRFSYPQAFAAGSHHLKESLGGANTALLLTSSLSMAMAVRAAQLADQKKLVRYLLITIALGTAFLCIKGVEYVIEWHDGLAPSLHFTWTSPDPARIDTAKVELFFVFYFIMTGLHATHMIVGIAVLGATAWLARRGRFTNGNPNFVEMAGLYWHFVDIVWIFLFPLLYLIR